MKLSPDFIAREVAGEFVIVPIGKASSAAGLITTNDVGACIWKQLEKGLDADGILAAVLDEFDVDSSTAQNDIDEFIFKLREIGAIE